MGTARDRWGDRVAGLLLGGALGDAVGRPFEGSSSVRTDAVEEVLGQECPAHGRPGHRDLVWTDNTAMMLTLAEHLAGLGSWHDLDEDALATAHARAWQAEPWRGYGAGPPQTICSGRSSRTWRRQGPRRRYGPRWAPSTATNPSGVARVTGTGITALEAAPAALAAFLHHPCSTVDAVRFAVRMGGDTDTVATMAGALAGAVAGQCALPPQLLGRLEAADRLRATGHALAGRTYSPSPVGE